MLLLLGWLMMSSQTMAQDAFNITLLSNWDEDTSAALADNQLYNDIWGYYDTVTKREYAILGTTTSTLFIDVTDPNTPKLCDTKPGRSQGTIHRDYKTYQHYAYAVSDEGPGSLQIFDLQYLPDSVHTVYDSDEFTVRTHNIFIENGKLYLAANKSNNGAFPMTILSLETPDKPSFLGNLTAFKINGSAAFNWVHDVYVRNDTAFCSNESAGMFIYDVRNPAAPVLISIISDYPEAGYNHSSWVTDDGQHLIFADETHAKGLKIYDISDIEDPNLESIFRSSFWAIPHNPFVKGDFLYVSYYHDGLYIFDIRNPDSVIVAGYYDTYPTNANHDGFQGCWGTYPYLPSGNILASDMENGLFVLETSPTLGRKDIENNILFRVHPNPFWQEISLQVFTTESHVANLELLDLSGRVLMHETLRLQIGENKLTVTPDEELASGLYIMKLTGDGFSVTKKAIKR